MQRATKRFPNLLTDNVDWIEMGFKSLFFFLQEWYRRLRVLDNRELYFGTTTQSE